MTQRKNETFETAVLEILRAINNTLAIQNKLLIDLLETIKIALQPKPQDTTQKIEMRINQRFGLLWWVVDKIAPAVMIAIVLAILKFLKLI